MVLDVLKTHQPALPEFTELVGGVDGVQRVEVTVDEIDEETVSLRVIIDGDIDYEEVKKYLACIGAEVHSVDRVVVEDYNRLAATSRDDLGVVVGGRGW
jgi:hypothetical protein